MTEYPHYKLYIVNSGGLVKPTNYNNIASTSEELKERVLNFYNKHRKYTHLNPAKQYCIQEYTDKYMAEIIETFKLKKDEGRTYYI